MSLKNEKPNQPAIHLRFTSLKSVYFYKLAFWKLITWNLMINYLLVEDKVRNTADNVKMANIRSHM